MSCIKIEKKYMRQDCQIIYLPLRDNITHNYLCYMSRFAASWHGIEQE